MSFTQHFAAISQVFSYFEYICSFLQYEYCEIRNVSMGFSKSLMPKVPYKSLVFDSWFDKIFGICDLENPILTFPPHNILSLPFILNHYWQFGGITVVIWQFFFFLKILWNHNTHLKKLTVMIITVNFEPLLWNFTF